MGNTNRLSSRATALAALLFATLAGFGQAAFARPTPVTFTGTVAPATVKRGDTATLTLQATIQSGYHMYSVVPASPPGPSTTVVSLTGKGITLVGKTTESKPTSEKDNNFGTVVSFHVDKATLTQKFKIGTTAPATGSLPLKVSVNYQACTDTFCLPPTTVDVAVKPLTIGAAKKHAMLSLPLQPIRLTGTDAPASDGLAILALKGFLAGLAALITPCVFPLIPVTFAFFTKRAQKEGGSVVKLASTYALGIVLCFTAIGAIAAPLFGAASASRIATNPITNVVFAVIFVVFGLALLEAVEIRLPSGLQRFAGGGSKTAGTLGVLGMGLTFVVSAFTCTAPFVGSILVDAAKATTGGQWLTPIVGMMTFSLGLALPFFLLGLFPSLLVKLPRSGAWLSTVKGTFGFIEFAAALKFLSAADLVWQLHILTQPVLLALWGIIAITGAIYLLGRLPIGLSYPTGTITPGRLIGASAFGAAAIVCVWGMAGRPLPELMTAFLPPSNYGHEAKPGDKLPEGELSYVSTLSAGLAQAKAENKPIFIDFTGYTCTNCRWMEKNIFVTGPVKSEMNKFVRIQLYTDGGPDGQKNQDYQEKTFGTVALPLYAVLTPDGKTVATSVGTTRDPKAFAAFLQKIQGPTQVSSR